MEYNFAMTCRQISQYFADLAEEYEKDMKQIKVRLDLHDREIVKNNETKKRILEALQEDLND